MGSVEAWWKWNVFLSIATFQVPCRRDKIVCRVSGVALADTDVVLFCVISR